MNRRRGSLSIEYGVLVVVAVAALLAMAVYFKRALGGRWRQVGDAFGYGRQYEPGVTRTTVVDRMPPNAPPPEPIADPPADPPLPEIIDDQPKP